MVLNPNLSTNSYVVCVFCTHGAQVRGAALRWESPGVSSDPCRARPGPPRRLRGQRVSPEPPASDNIATADEQIMIEDCASSTPCIRWRPSIWRRQGGLR